jgi:alkyl sulfatase BDS1-like metallo-beta-lactamase superfamily hydrolase
MPSLKIYIATVALIFTANAEAASGGDIVASDPTKHFDPKGKLPSTFTVAAQKQQSAILPFEDERDFEEQQRGFIAAPDYKQIMAEAGNVAWDMGSYEWLLQGKNFDSIHPSLQRQAILNMNYGLYEVLPGKIYQLDHIRSVNCKRNGSRSPEIRQ